MRNLKNIAIIGSGPTAIYLLKNIYNHIDILKQHISRITIFEKERISGMGMPYNPEMTDIHNLANISSEEIPLLLETFADWLRAQSENELTKLNIIRQSINEKDVYSRVALGDYFHNQFEQLLELLKIQGITVTQFCESEVLDIEETSKNQLQVKDSKQLDELFSSVVIATGHGFRDKDRPKEGYYATPWPIHKLLPKKDEIYNFPIGILGASLSAFDVVTSLSHRHGKFITSGNKQKFTKFNGVSDFKIVLHAAQGWLPHLQYEQQEPIREIYRHFNRQEILALRDAKGFLHIEDYFDQLCRKALINAFTKDKMTNVAEELQNINFSFKDFIKTMSERHEYTNSFEGMKSEMVKARHSVENNIPIHWMETLDDLMYSLNYHAELMPAEDHQFFHKEIMAFLMNVIAALPLQSAEILLALYDAKCIELKEGYVTIERSDPKSGKTKITLKSKNGKEKKYEYQLFVNCGGQEKMEFEDFPFPTLVKQGIVREAEAKFSTPIAIEKGKPEDKESNKNLNETELKLSGIDVDASYRTINEHGQPNNYLYDINFTHTTGLRPYSYGLQACNATSKILVESWLTVSSQTNNKSNNILEITKIYEAKEDL